MRNERYQSWGRYPRADHKVRKILWRSDLLPVASQGDRYLLPFGNGRSYGDSCLNDGHTLLDTRELDRLVSFDAEKGVLCCEAGTLLCDLFPLIIPKGWFVPVTPGTQFVTVGGAIANDVHGKNHHRAGTFGCHVRRFELLRSDGQRALCSPEENADWFKATIGGLGLTGVITWAEIQLRPIHGSWIDAENIHFSNVDEFFDLSTQSDREYEYTVGWVDCMAKGKALGRGIFTRGNHATSSLSGRPPIASRLLAVPFDLPSALLNTFTIAAFNFAYYHSHLRRHTRSLMHFEPFFYPLDAIQDWNRAYGRNGFLQYQCVVPLEDGEPAIREILEMTSHAGEGSFLGVLKIFGARKSPGLMSFPREGITLALDFPIRGQRTYLLLDQIDKIVERAGGAVYPAKDARMSAHSFQRYFPQWKAFRAYIDPRFSSSFWRRVTADKT
jgi:FAD/FMN-containing dehydrogenase